MEPESSSEQQDPTQTLTPEHPLEEVLQSTDLGTPEEESSQHEGEHQPLQESGKKKPQQEAEIWAK